MSLLLAGILFLVGLGTMFIAPWVGDGLLAVALVLGAVGLVSAMKNADEVVDYEPVKEAPHMRDPDDPHTGVD
jgi:hypothetical protein